MTSFSRRGFFKMKKITNWLNPNFCSDGIIKIQNSGSFFLLIVFSSFEWIKQLSKFFSWYNTNFVLFRTYQIRIFVFRGNGALMIAFPNLIKTCSTILEQAMLWKIYKSLFWKKLTEVAFQEPYRKNVINWFKFSLRKSWKV